MPKSGAQTIYALSSGRLPSGVAVIRLSGPLTGHAMTALGGALPPARELRLRTLRHPDGTVIDKGLSVFFPGPDSFTGEDCGEIHVHGGRAVVAATLRALACLDGVRQADPGEFTRRAFVNGRLDLVQAEALSDLIDAETEMQRRLAVEAASGRHAARYRAWRKRLLAARADVEADLDFSDQEDVPEGIGAEVLADLASLAAEIEQHAAGYAAAELVRDGFKVAIMGRPNVGKSSLLNYLAKRDVAIVTDQAGTTRDVIEIALDLGGNKVVLADMAGLRETEDAVESIGVARARDYGRSADLVLHLLDGTCLEAPDEIETGAPVILVATKQDADFYRRPSAAALEVSVRSGRGIDALLVALQGKVEASTAIVAEALPFRERHVVALRAAASCLRSALAGTVVAEIRAEEMRRAAHELGRITGDVDVEELLGEIFRRFCIGK